MSGAVTLLGGVCWHCCNVFIYLFLFLFVQVMLAASYWSLLAPAIDIAGSQGYYGNEGQYTWMPVALGFALGGLFVHGSDMLLPSLVSFSVDTELVLLLF